MRSALLLLVLPWLACGRTPLNEGLDGGVDAGAVIREAPLYVFTGRSCPDAGTEADLVPQKDEELTLVRFRAVDECSGVGGEWFLGRDFNGQRDFFVGEHACYFFPQPLRGTPELERVAVVRYSQTAALFQTPEGWCLTDENGKEPVRSSAISLAWGVYRSEAAARAAWERLKASR